VDGLSVLEPEGLREGVIVAVLDADAPTVSVAVLLSLVVGVLDRVAVAVRDEVAVGVPVRDAVMEGVTVGVAEPTYRTTLLAVSAMYRPARLSHAAPEPGSVSVRRRRALSEEPPSPV